MDRTIKGGFAANDEIVFEKRSESVCTPICEKIITGDLSDDFTLPDYKPEIRRLLKISTTLPSPSSYISNSTAEFSGDVIYSVLYVGGDGKLSSASLTSVYEADAPFDFDGDIESVLASDELEAENIVGRVIAPRKLNIRCRLRHRIRIEAKCPTSVELTGNSESDSIMRLTDMQASCVRVFGEDDSHEITEDLSLPSNAIIIESEAVPLIEHCELKNGGAECRGAVYLKVLYGTDGGDPFMLERKIPFEAIIPIGGDGEGWECRVWGCVPNVITEITETGAVSKMRLSLCAEAQKNVPAEVTKDIFATNKRCDISRESARVIVAANCSTGNFTVSGSSELSGLPDSFEVVAATATAEADELLAENGKYQLLGKCRFSAVIFGDGEYSCREFELPFKYEFGITEGSPDDYSAKLACPVVKIRGDKNALFAEAEVNAAVRVWSDVVIDVVKEASFAEDPDISRRPAYTVVYVGNGETVWSIAKKYFADPAEIISANGLRISSIGAPESLHGVDFLII